MSKFANSKRLAHRCRVIVVDDSATNLAVMVALARSIEAVDVRGFGCPYQAFQKAVENPPDVMVVDYHMPGLDGLAFADLIAGSCSRKPQILLVSHDRSNDLAARAAAHGISVMIRKPFDVGQFRMAIQDAGLTK
jgi:putative two-component system response regulator